MESLHIKHQLLYNDYDGNFVTITGRCYMHGNQRQALDLAYIAGLMDGEGSYCILKAETKETLRQTNRKSPVYYSVIRVGMTQREPMEFIHNIFGFGIVRDEGVRKDRPTYQPMYRWTLHKKDQILEFCKELLPYSRVKKKQIQNIIDFFEGWEKPYNRKMGISEKELLRRERHLQIARELNAVGAAATTKSQGRREAEVIV